MIWTRWGFGLRMLSASRHAAADRHCWALLRRSGTPDGCRVQGVRLAPFSADADGGPAPPPPTPWVVRVAEARNSSEVMRIVTESRVSGHPPNLLLTQAAVNRCVDLGELGAASRLVEAMERPDLTCYNALIRGYAKLGDQLSLEESIDKLLAAGLLPDALTYRSLVVGFVGCGQMELAAEAVVSMAERGLSPPIDLCNAFLLGCSSHQGTAVDHMLRFFESMGEPPLPPPDTTSYTMMIRALIRKQRRTRALELLERMVQDGVPRNKEIYVSLISAFNQSAAAQDLASAKRLLLLVSEEGKL